MIINQEDFFKKENKLKNYCYWTNEDGYEDKSINYKNFPQCFFQIIALFAEDCDNNIENITIMHGTLEIVSVNNDISSKNNLYLRYIFDNDKVDLVVAKVEFIHTRCGYMTKLYECLKNIRDRYNLGAIMIECANSEEMQKWCDKNNFVRYGMSSEFGNNNNYIEKIFYSNEFNLF